MTTNERLAPAWSAYHVEAPTAGGRDLLGLGDLGEQLAEVLLPNLRATAWRARYFTLLSLAVWWMPEDAIAPEDRRGWVFDVEKSWLLAIVAHHLAAAGNDVQETTARMAEREQGLLGRGRGRLQSPTVSAGRSLLSTATVHLDRFTPLQAPQTSGVYGRYVGAARKSRLLKDSRRLELDELGERVIRAAYASAQIKKENKAEREVQATLSKRIFRPRGYVGKALGRLRLGNIKVAAAKEERAALAAALLESNERTRLTAAVLRRALGDRKGSITKAVARAMAKALPAGAPSAELREVLDELPGFDEARRAVDRLFAAVSAHTEKAISSGGSYEFRRDEVARAAAVKAAAGELSAALAAVRSGHHPIVAPLRDAIDARARGAKVDGLGLIADLHRSAMERRGLPAWFRLDGDVLHVDRSAGMQRGGEPSADDDEAVVAELGRYRLGAARSLIQDLGWRGVP